MPSSLSSFCFHCIICYNVRRGVYSMNPESKYTVKKTFSAETVVFPVIFLAFFAYLAHVMGMANMINTIMKTAFDLLINTVLYIVAVCVIMGAISGLSSDCRALPPWASSPRSSRTIRLSWRSPQIPAINIISKPTSSRRSRTSARPLAWDLSCAPTCCR